MKYFFFVKKYVNAKKIYMFNNIHFTFVIICNVSLWIARGKLLIRFLNFQKQFNGQKICKIELDIKRLKLCLKQIGFKWKEKELLVEMKMQT